MNHSILNTAAELKAKEAEALHAFSGLNLLHIRREITKLLGLIGREGIFDQYTPHDIGHIEKMLHSLDWIIPEKSKQQMSTTDWLMTVLAIYFHDLGMLVTKSEFNDRQKTDFPRFVEENLFSGSAGTDYKARVSAMEKDAAERFLYQEFVRSNHAIRVKNWVSGKNVETLGVAGSLVEEIDKLLTPLGNQFRRDFGMICESHHLNDLGDRKKYKTAEPYGNSDSETANLQYCAVLLRTADLLHITSDRSPSIVFKVINPSDPISQNEWAKQQAVTRVQPAPALDEEGNVDIIKASDTIKVSAYFKQPDGFFGLTSYLAYCSEQLKLSNQWIAAANAEDKTKLQFPWRKIDDTNIQTEGFIRDTFEFSLDQGKILDLLTGHTLYNDTKVVLRELVQNALDAIRIYNYKKNYEKLGRVDIKWNESNRLLSVTDNGTGMTQKFISSFLLKVGTSRYQDADFKKQYPEFSSISRFGIGVLSTFMISDNVDILTCHEDETDARRLTLKSVHGKYLIQTLDKNSEDVISVYPHGTSFQLKIRPSVNIVDIVEIAKSWIIFPGCDVHLHVNSKAPVRIGYTRPSEAVAAYLDTYGIKTEIVELSAPLEQNSKSTVRIVEKSVNGVTIAYAVQWSPYFNEWTFLSSPERNRSRRIAQTGLGTCIEGIRVEFSTPGYFDNTIVAIANVCGPNAPKTNVARSGIESTAERDKMLRTLYGVYKNHIADEITELQTSRSYSLTWAVDEAKYFAAALYGTAISKPLLDDSLRSLEVLLIEEAGKRSAMSPEELARLTNFWTIECTLLQPAEHLIREAKTQASLVGIVGALGISDFRFPSGPILCGAKASSIFGSYAFKDREVDVLDVNIQQRRIDLRWTNVGETPRWQTFPSPLPEVLQRVFSDRYRRQISINSIYIGCGDIEVRNYTGAVLSTSDEIFIIPNTPLADYLAPKLMELNRTPDDTDLALSVAFKLNVVQMCLNYSGKIADLGVMIEREYSNWHNSLGVSVGNNGIVSELTDVLANIHWEMFAPSKWSRKIIFNDQEEY